MSQTNSSAVHIEDLPPEVLVLIFRYLDAWSLCSVARVNKQWNLLSETPRLWRICFVRRWCTFTAPIPRRTRQDPPARSGSFHSAHAFGSHASDTYARWVNPAQLSSARAEHSDSTPSSASSSGTSTPSSTPPFAARTRHLHHEPSASVSSAFSAAHGSGASSPVSTSPTVSSSCVAQAHQTPAVHHSLPKRKLGLSSSRRKRQRSYFVPYRDLNVLGRRVLDQRVPVPFPNTSWKQLYRFMHENWDIVHDYACAHHFLQLDIRWAELMGARTPMQAATKGQIQHNYHLLSCEHLCAWSQFNRGCSHLTCRPRGDHLHVWHLSIYS